MRILVVDDDRGVRESLRRSLELNGYTVELAEDGQKAMDEVTRQRPDAMVLDMTMPRVDGLEVCRRLRSAGDDLPVLVLTARDAVSDRVAGLNAGADDYLPKPFLLEELLARLRALLRRSTFDRLGGTGAAPTFTDSDPSAHEADAATPPIEVSVGGVESVTPSRPVKRQPVIVAAIGLIPPFTGTFWVHDVPGSKASHIDDASCFIIRNCWPFLWRRSFITRLSRMHQVSSRPSARSLGLWSAPSSVSMSAPWRALRVANTPRRVVNRRRWPVNRRRRRASTPKPSRTPSSAVCQRWQRPPSQEVRPQWPSNN